MLNMKDFPDETPCPDCGRMIEGEEDPLGIVYQCTSLDCGATYTGEDLFPENYPSVSLPVHPAPAVPDDVEIAGGGLLTIVEGITGAMKHGTWRDENGVRLKDTPEWVAFYNAINAANRAALTQPTGGSND